MLDCNCNICPDDCPTCGSNGGEHKHRRIVMHKNMIFKDVDALNMKLADINDGTLTDLVRDAIASDATENLDGSVLSAFAEERDARLRKKMECVLAEEVVFTVDNCRNLSEQFDYDLILDPSFSDSQLKPLATLMHSYFVKGILLDWYNRLGTEYGALLAPEVAELESKIVNAFKLPEFVRRPGAPYYWPSYKVR